MVSSLLQQMRNGWNKWEYGYGMGSIIKVMDTTQLTFTCSRPITERLENRCEI